MRDSSGSPPAPDGRPSVSAFPAGLPKRNLQCTLKLLTISYKTETISFTSFVL